MTAVVAAAFSTTTTTTDSCQQKKKRLNAALHTLFEQLQFVLLKQYFFVHRETEGAGPDLLFHTFSRLHFQTNAHIAAANSIL